MAHALTYDPWPPVWDEAAVAALPEDGHRYEIYEGALLVTPPANWEHQGVESDLLVTLHQTAPAGWRVLTDLGVDCGNNKLVPDVAVIRPGGAQHNKLYGPARGVALVVEVESPSTRLRARADRSSAKAAGAAAYGDEGRQGDENAGRGLSAEAMNDRNAKLTIYAQAGIPSYWRVERAPGGRVIVVYELAGDDYIQLHRLEPGQSATLTQPYPLELVNEL